MFRRLLLAGAGLAAMTTLAAGPASAQTTAAQTDAPQATAPQTAAPRTEALPPVLVEGDAKAGSAYGFGDPLDSGTSTFDAEAVATRSPGSGDVNQLLKALPSTHFSLTEGLATRQNLQDLRPSEISISGGRINENLFVLDGVDASSRLDFSNSDASNYDQVAAASPQAFWVDANLVGSVIVRDSNVSAEYGRFAGGVVEVITRSPASTPGSRIYYNATSTDLTSFKISPATRDALGGVTPDKPEYDKRRYGFSLDLPIGEKIRLLAGYNRSEAEVTYFRGPTYGSTAFGQKSRSDNFLLKGEVDLPDAMLLSGQLTYTPYETQGSNALGVNNMVTSRGGGWTGRVSLAGSRGDADWTLWATASLARTDRDGPPTQYNVTRVGTGIDWCSASACNNGFIGPLKQRENNYSLRGLWSQPLFGGEFRGGFDVTHAEAYKKRPFTTYAYSRASVGANTACADPNEGLSCVDGRYALTNRLQYRAFEAEVSFATAAVWGEQTFDAAGFTVRTGLRLEHDSLLGNWDLSPRISATRDLPFGVTATVGLNRYYARSFLGYAMRENTPGNYRYERVATVSGGKQVWSDNWRLTFASEAGRYSDAGLSTPYSDEATLSLRGPLLGGTYRINGILRENRDEFARSEASRVTYVTELGTTSTYAIYRLTNNGKSSYRGLNLEWKRASGRHALTVSTSVSKTKTSNVDYFEESDDEAFASVMVYYNGAVRPLLSVLADNQRGNFAAPLIVNADWASVWWDGRIKANVNARFRGRFEQIADTNQNIRVDGVSYDVYGKVEYDPSVDFNLNLSADVVRAGWGTVTLDARVDNLLDSLPYRNGVSTSQPYQLGRTIWLGAKYSF